MMPKTGQHNTPVNDQRFMSICDWKQCKRGTSHIYISSPLTRQTKRNSPTWLQKHKSSKCKRNRSQSILHYMTMNDYKTFTHDHWQYSPHKTHCHRQKNIQKLLSHKSTCHTSNLPNAHFQLWFVCSREIGHTINSKSWAHFLTQ